MEKGLPLRTQLEDFLGLENAGQRRAEKAMNARRKTASLNLLACHFRSFKNRI
jgi:hypothetical protein